MKKNKWIAQLVLLVMLFNLCTPMMTMAAETSQSGTLAELVNVVDQLEPIDEVAQEQPNLNEVQQQSNKEASDDQQNNSDDSTDHTGSLDQGDQQHSEGSEEEAGEAPKAEAEQQPVLAAKTTAAPIGQVTFSIETRVIDGADLLVPTEAIIFEGDTVFDVFSRLCEANNIAYTGEPSWITSINDVGSDGDKYHQRSGWMFMVNGVFGNELANQQLLNNNDNVRFVFCISDDYLSRSDIAFADDYLNLKAQIEIAQGKSSDDYDTEAQWALLQGLLEESQALIDQIEQYDSPLKADGLPGYILDHDVSQSGENAQQMTRLISDLTNAIAGQAVHVPVEKIIIQPEALTLYVGQQYQLKATVYPSYATDQKLIWTIAYNFDDGLNSDISNGLVKVEKYSKTPISVNVTCQDFIDNLESPTTVKITIKELGEVQQAAQSALNQGADWLLNQNNHFATRETNSDLDAFILARLGKMDATASQNYYNALEKYVIENKAIMDTPLNDHFLNKVTNWSKIVLATTALGYEPTNIGGVNFIEKIVNYDLHYLDTAVCNYLLLALDSKPYEPIAYEREDIISELLKRQTAVGGFQGGWAVDPDSTGEALMALAPYVNHELVIKQDAITRGLTYLSDEQAEQGYYSSFGSPSPWSTGRVLLGISGLGIDPLGSSDDDKLFQKSQGNVLSGILQFVKMDHGFNSASGVTGNLWATEDCLLGLSAYQRLVTGQEGLFDLSSCQLSIEALTMELTKAKEIKQGEYTKKSFAHLSSMISQVEEVIKENDMTQVTKAYYDLRQAIEQLKKNIAPDSSGNVEVPNSHEKQGITVEENKDLSITVTEGNTGDVYLELPSGGKMPQIKVDHTLNGQPLTMTIPKNNVASGTDMIQLPKAMVPASIEVMLNQAIKNTTEVKQYFKVGGDAAINFTEYITLTLSDGAGASAAYVDQNNKINLIDKVATEQQGQGKQEYCYDQGKDLVIKTKHFTGFIAYTIKSTSGGGDMDQSIKLIVDASKANTAGNNIGFATIEKSSNYYTGISALTVLEDQVDDVVHSNGYVTHIKGLGELDCGPKSGWMYSVNGDFPNQSASQYALSPGDRVKWEYTLNLGDDIGGGSSGNNPLVADPTIDPIILAQMSQQVDNALLKMQKTLQNKQQLTPWEVVALAQQGEKMTEKHYQHLQAEVAQVKGSFRKVTDLQKMVMAVSALGHSATDVGGYNLIEAIYNHDNLTKQGNNGVIFGLLALDSGEYTVPSEAKWTREAMIDHLLKAQNNDGGFALTSDLASDVDITAMAIQALAPYQGQKQVQQALDQSIAYLSEVQRTNGGFVSNGVANSESTAQVIMALTAMGINPVSDQRFNQDKNDPLANLLAYQNADGTFNHTVGGASDQMATEQGLLALVSIKRLLAGQSSLYQMDKTITAVSKASDVFTDQHLIASWAQEGVLLAAKQGYIAGYVDGQFKPQQQVTRGEFVAILARTLGWELTQVTNQHFKDIPAGAWYASAANYAYEKGFVQGQGNGQFKGNQVITREEMATILYQVKPMATKEAPTFSDQSLVSPWATEALTATYNNGILVGFDGAIDPKGVVTREMAAIIALRIK